jgi:preprotein translocase subunit SecE
MSDEPKKKKDARPNFFQEKFTEYRSEFRKIVWPSREQLIKHTITTIVISLIFGALITVLDGAFGVAFTSFVGFIS